MALKDFLTEIAEAIREVKDTEGKINAQNFASEIRGLSSGGGSENERTSLSTLADMTITEVTARDLQGATFLKTDLFKGIATFSVATIPSSVKYMGETVFATCNGLTEVVFEGDLEAESGNVLGARVFAWCPNLRKVTFKGDIKGAINYGLFQSCSKLEVVNMSKCTQIPTITGGLTHFEGVPSTCKVIIPDSLYDNWTTATNWVSFTNIAYVKASEYTEA